MKTLNNKKIVSNNACFCSVALLTSKFIIEIIENHSKVSGCAKSCNMNKCIKLILINHEITYDTFLKRHLHPVALLTKVHGPPHVYALQHPGSSLCGPSMVTETKFALSNSWRSSAATI